MPKDRSPLLSVENTNEPAVGRTPHTSVCEAAGGVEPTARVPLLDASNEFLNREIALLEEERDALQVALNEIRQTYGWKVVDGYRRWLTRLRDQHPSFSKLYEAITVWGLKRVVGAEAPNQTKQFELRIERPQLSRERLKGIHASAAAFTYRPLMTVVASIDGCAVKGRLTGSIESVLTQLYPNWQLRIRADKEVGEDIQAVLGNYANRDSRIKVELVREGASTLNADWMEGEFVTFLELGSELGTDALFEVVRTLNRQPLADLIYWDEGLETVGSRIEPIFKPNWNPDLLLSTNFVGATFAIRKKFIEKIVGTSQSLDVNNLFGILLRGVESTSQIVHIPKILSYRCKPGEGGAADQDRADAQLLEEALRRRELRGTVTSPRPGHYSVRYEIRGQPLISILIPTRNQCALLRRCLASIEEKTDYHNYEIILLDNSSSDAETLEFFKTIADRVRIVPCPGPFNFSAINNRGVKEARGDFLLFLNNDTEVINNDWLRAMIEQAQRPEVGAVGAKLLFPDGQIQHAGIVLGFGGPTVHAFRLGAGQIPDCLWFVDAIRDCSAVTAACLMIRHPLFNEIQGFDEGLAVDFNDVDLCLRLRELGYLIVYQPRALLYHHEAATRGRADHPSDEERFSRRWASLLQRGDPYYGRNLVLFGERYSAPIKRGG